MECIVLKDIEGMEGRYAVTTNGMVWSHKRQKFLKAGLVGKGYLAVSICPKGEKSKHRYIHRLVAQAFIPNPDNKPTVNHKDGNKQNNDISNLEWATQKEQIAHAVSEGLSNLVGEGNGYSKLTESKVLEIRSKYSSMDYSHEQLAKEYGVTRVCILKVVKGKTWSQLPYDKDVASTSRYKDRGENHGSAKLTDEQIKSIRKAYAEGGCTQRSLADEFGVSGASICSILNNKSYISIEENV